MKLMDGIQCECEYIVNSHDILFSKCNNENESKNNAFIAACWLAG